MENIEPATAPGGGVSEGVAQARHAFGAELRRFREQAGLSQTVLARSLGYHASYISKIEAGRYNPPRDLARRAGDLLHASDELLISWQRYSDRRTGNRVDVSHRHAAEDRIMESAVGEMPIRVINEIATLTYDDDRCVISVFREIENPGNAVVNGFPIRVHVDGFPDDPERSREFHRAHPLRWDELEFRCWYAQSIDDFDRVGAVELDCDPRQTVTDKLIEAWILFQGKRFGETFPLHLNQRMMMRYSYVVTAAQWGAWYQRHVRFPTDRIATVLDFPSRLKPLLWGKERTLGKPRIGPLESPIVRTTADDRTIWSWALDCPGLGDRYRFEWRFSP